MKTMMFVLLMAVTTQAESVTYTARFDNRLPLPSVPDFDTSLGDLIAVTITWTGQAGGYWSSIAPITQGTLNVMFGAMDGPTYLGTSWTTNQFVFPQPTNLFPTESEVSLTVSPDPGPWMSHVTTSLTCDAWITSTTSVQGGLTRLSGTETIVYTYAVPEPSGIVLGTVAAILVGVGLKLRRGRDRSKS